MWSFNISVAIFAANTTLLRIFERKLPPEAFSVLKRHEECPKLVFLSI